MNVALSSKLAGGRLLALSLTLFCIGCYAGPGPRLFPASPLTVEQLAGGGERRWYNMTGDKAGDYYEQLSPKGRITEIGYGSRNGTPRAVKLDEIPPAEQRQLLLLLDSVPYSLVEEYYQNGRFRFFYPPAVQISPFPVMTDISFAEFFRVSPEGGVEAEYYDGKRMTSGYDVYASGTNAKWEKYSQYVLSPLCHPEMYLFPLPWTDHEFRRIEETYLEAPRQITVGYSVGTSSLGSNLGRAGHEHGLDDVERMCQHLIYATEGRARISILSDHGHAFYDGTRIPLSQKLKELGYRPTKGTLKDPRDVGVPEFGLVSCAVIYTQSAAAVARDCLKIEGIELSAYVDGRDVVVLGRGGSARISKSGERYRYAAEQGDPLQILPAIEQLKQRGDVDPDGFIPDDALFAATAGGTYPDGVYRLWRAFNGLVEHTPDVMLSIAEPYYAGSPTMKMVLRRIVGVHGSLEKVSSYGMCMTMAGHLPPIQRQEDLRAHLIRLGVPVPGPTETQPSGNTVARSGAGSREGA